MDQPTKKRRCILSDHCNIDDSDEIIHLTDLPLELLVMILEWMEPDELPWVRPVCNALNAAVLIVYKSMIARKLVPTTRLTWKTTIVSGSRVLKGIEWWESYCEHPMQYYEPCVCAVEQGRLDTLQLMTTRGMPWSLTIGMTALEKGDRTIIAWMIRHGMPTYDALWHRLVVQGDTDGLEWLHSHGLAIDFDAIWRHAVTGDKPEFLQWMEDSGRGRYDEWATDCNCIIAFVNESYRALEWSHPLEVDPIKWPCGGNCHYSLTRTIT